MARYMVLVLLLLAGCASQEMSDKQVKAAYEEHIALMESFNNEYKAAIVRVLEDPLLTLNNSCGHYDADCITAMLDREYDKVKRLEIDVGLCHKLDLSLGWPDYDGWCESYLKKKLRSDYVKLSVLLASSRMKDDLISQSEQHLNKDSKGLYALYMADITTTLATAVANGIFMSSSQFGPHITDMHDFPQDRDRDANDLFIDGTEDLQAKLAACIRPELGIGQPSASFYEILGKKALGRASGRTPLLRSIYLYHAVQYQRAVSHYANNSEEEKEEFAKMDYQYTEAAERQEFIENIDSFLMSRAVIGISGSLQHNVLIYYSDNRNNKACEYLIDLDVTMLDNVSKSFAWEYLRAKADCGRTISEEEIAFLRDKYEIHEAEIEILKEPTAKMPPIFC